MVGIMQLIGICELADSLALVLELCSNGACFPINTSNQSCADACTLGTIQQLIDDHSYSMSWLDKKMIFTFDVASGLVGVLCP